VADALLIALEGEDGPGALALLEQIKTDLIEERKSWARVLYVLYAAAAVGVVAEVSCRYFHEIGYPGPVDLGLAVERIGNTSVIYRIGLFQGGLVPAYAIIIREYFAPTEAGLRVGIVIMATLFGMALGGWMSGAMFDFTGSYRAAFVNSIGWNLLNLSLALFLLRRAQRGAQPHFQRA